MKKIEQRVSIVNWVVQRITQRDQKQKAIRINDTIGIDSNKRLLANDDTYKKITSQRKLAKLGEI